MKPLLLSLFSLLLVAGTMPALSACAPGSSVVDPPPLPPDPGHEVTPGEVSSPNQVEPSPRTGDSSPSDSGTLASDSAPPDAGSDSPAQPPLLGKETRTYDVTFVKGVSDCRTFAGNANVGLVVTLDHDAGTASLTIETWTGTAEASWNPSSGLLTVPSTLFMIPSQAGLQALRITGSWTLTATTLTGTGTFSNQMCIDEPRIAEGVIRSRP